MMKILFAAVLAAFLWPVPVAAQQLPPGCMLQADAREAFWLKFGERPVAFGVLENGMLFEVFVNADGDFSLFVTDTNEISCIKGNGTDFQQSVKGMRPKGRPL